jgi:DNA-binding response OmpR family regulator
VKILVVDDDEDTTTLLAMLLGRRGWHVDAAGSVGEAQTALSRNDYSVLITDLNLPDAAGTALFSNLSQTSVRLAIVISGAHEDAARARDTHRGVQYLSKPVDGLRLIRTIEALVPEEHRS